MWILRLNDMRSSQIQDMTDVCRGDSIGEFLALLGSETVVPYTEPRSGSMFWGKTFRKGGPLEWFNRPDSIHLSNHFEEVPVLTLAASAVDRARRAYLHLPHVMAWRLEQHGLEAAISAARPVFAPAPVETLRFGGSSS